jgi:hypothetical protein
LRKVLHAAALLILACPSATAGTVWNEIQDGGADAARLPNNAQVTIGGSSDPLTDIFGRLVSGIIGADMYLIRITDFANFSATTSAVGANGVADPALYLFDFSGHGIYGSDNISPPTNLQAMLPADDPNGPQSDGLYFLVITPAGNDPLNKFGNFIFPCGCTAGAFGPTAKNTIIQHYSNFGIGGPDGNGKYDIHLTGAGFAAANPEPGTLGLLGFGSVFGGMLLRRRPGKSIRPTPGYTISR